MSTRAQIGFYETKKQDISKPNVLIYKHSDGYPEGVLELLTDFCTRFAKQRGLSDTEYAGAWYLFNLVNQHVKWTIKFNKETGMKRSAQDFLGHGICQNFHGDIEYFYRVHPNEIEVYKTGFDAAPDKFEKIQTITIL